jgi:hypothetical protein
LVAATFTWVLENMKILAEGGTLQPANPPASAKVRDYTPKASGRIPH